MSTNHTPGPWWVSQMFEYRVVGNRSDAEGTFVADCDSRGEGGKQDAANMRLIAAAPELLEAAKRVAYSNGFDAAYPDNLKTLIAVIAKAEGRQS